MRKLILLTVVSLLGLSSCVSTRIHKNLQRDYESLEQQYDSLLTVFNDLEARHREWDEALTNAKQLIIKASNDSVRMQRNYIQLRRDYDELNRAYDFLLENNKALLSKSSAENRQLLQRLEKAQEDLAAREDSLRKERAELDGLRYKLSDREKQVNELESMLLRKDSIMNYVKNKISEALLNFEGKGLSVEMRGGNVYVTLENALLFKSASWELDKPGQEALGQLASVLADNTDLNVLVEGHTDADAYRGRGEIKDNWDLSVMRATSIIRELSKNAKVNTARLTAAGRSEYVPVADNESTEGKAKNRRTEIIITPALDELAELMDELEKK